MSRMRFDSDGKLLSVDGSFTESKETGSEVSLEVLDNSEDTEFWSLYKNGKRLEPLRFSNGKTQEDVVKEVVDLINQKHKMIFLHGMCGTGKSAIALNISRVLGKAAVVVPVKGLQRQYQEDYMDNMSVLKQSGKKMKISVITGRENHDSVFKPGVSCADPYLPDTIQINEKNSKLLKEYYEMNPLVKNKSIGDVRMMRRISVAPVNPYWSPIIPAEFEVQLRDASRKRYLGLNNREFIFYHRRKGCRYYDQYQAYIDSDVIIFNSAKYKVEVALDRKPETEIDIIDEADEFLDSFSNQRELNLTRLGNALRAVVSDEPEVMAILDTIKEIISLEEKRIRAVGVNEEQIFHIKDTNMGKILNLFLKNRNVESEISLDDLNYANKAVEVAKEFVGFFGDTYLTYRKHEDNLYVNLVTTNLSKRLKEILDKSKAFVFMSGTLHSRTVLDKIFGIDDYKVVEAETLRQGDVEILRTGKEFDCSYRNFRSGNFGKEDYYRALNECVSRAEKPLLVHVNAFEDLPSSMDIGKLGLYGALSRERLYELQAEDKTGRMVSLFKKGMADVLYSTKCSRGVDFPGEICRSMIYTKYPNPNINGTFWKILHRTHSQYFWEFYKDKARREFLQRLYRALRSKDDSVFVLSPDTRVLDAVRELQIINKS